MVAQVNKKHAAMIAHSMHPAGEANGGADVGLAEGGKGGAAISVHFGILDWCGAAAISAENHDASRRKIGAKSAWSARFVKTSRPLPAFHPPLRQCLGCGRHGRPRPRSCTGRKAPAGPTPLILFLTASTRQVRSALKAAVVID